MDICRDCVFTKEAGKFCANPVVITEYEGPGGSTPLSLLTEGIVKSAHIRQFAGSTECKGYSEKPGMMTLLPGERIHYLDGQPLIEPMRECLGADGKFYEAGFWLLFVAPLTALIVIWKLLV